MMSYARASTHTILAELPHSFVVNPNVGSKFYFSSSENLGIFLRAIQISRVDDE